MVSWKQIKINEKKKKLQTKLELGKYTNKMIENDFLCERIIEKYSPTGLRVNTTILQHSRIIIFSGQASQAEGAGG